MPPSVTADGQVTKATIPERVGRYEIVLPIASGGMATVYLARAVSANGFARQVALKLTHAHLRETVEFTNDLLEEAKLASGVSHPNVVPVLEVDEDPLGMYLIMEYVEGETLGGLRRRTAAMKRPLPPAIGMRVLLDAMAGLHAAHELRDESGELVNLVHRDFSPQNIIVGIDGVARLTDFGIAKAASRLGHTRSGLVKGKISYMAPEQARSLPLDRRCDVWAAGVIAWEVLAQRRLHPAGDGDVGTLLKVVSEEPPPLRSVQSDVPVEIERIVARALTIDRDRRYGSALEMSRDLTAACRATGLLADHDEVAAFLGEIVGAKLAERRGRAGEVLRLRAKMGAPGSSKETDERIALELENAIRPLAEMLEPESDSDIEAAIGPLLPDTRVRPMHSASDASELKPVEPVLEQTTTSSATSLALPEEPPPASRTAAQSGFRLPWLFLAGAALLAFGVALGASLQRGAPAGATSPSSAATTVTVTTVPAAPTVTASTAAAPIASAIGGAKTPEPPASASASAASSASRASVVVHANVAVASLDVDGRPVPLAIATREPLLDLVGDERTRAVNVTARATDGREVTVVIEPAASEVTLEFPAARSPKRPPRRGH